MDLQYLKNRHRRLTLKSRQIERIISSALFEDLWGLATEKEQSQLHADVEALDLEAIREWVLPDDACDRFTLRELRQLGSKHGVSYYSRMTKEQLVTELLEKGINVAKLTPRFIELDATAADSRRGSKEASEPEIKDTAGEDGGKSL